MGTKGPKRRFRRREVIGRREETLEDRHVRKKGMKWASGKGITREGERGREEGGREERGKE